MLQRDLIYSQASQPIAQYFQVMETRMRLLRFLIKSQNGFPQYSNKFDTVSIIETRMRFELINNGFAIRRLNLSAILSFAILIGFEYFDKLNTAPILFVTAHQRYLLSYSILCGEQRDRTFTAVTQNRLAGECNKPIFAYSPQRKEWELNPHESLTPNCFQDSGHRQLACPSIR